MPLKLLLPVLPSERFYDAVVAAGDIVAREGGTVTFLFTRTRPPPEWEEREDVGFDLNLETDAPTPDEEQTEAWQQTMIGGMTDATDLLLERGIDEGRVTYLFADEGLPIAEAVAGEAAAGGFDMVVLPQGALARMPEGMPYEDIAAAVQELAGEGVKLIVT